MPQDAFSRWASRFRRDSAKDNMALLRAHLQQVGLPDNPEKLIDGTIMYMSGCCAYLNIDGRSFDEFLATQQYRPRVDCDTHYSLTFNLLGRSFGRIITPLHPHCVDLADLYGHPWNDFRMCGYSDFRVARLDDEDLSEEEIANIEKAITYDIRFDYTEQEVEIFIDRDTVTGVLVVYCQDVIDEENDTGI